MQITQLDLAGDADDLAAAYPAFRAGALEAKPGFPAPGRIRLRTRALGRDGQFSQDFAALAAGARAGTTTGCRRRADGACPPERRG